MLGPSHLPTAFLLVCSASVAAASQVSSQEFTPPQSSVVVERADDLRSVLWNATLEERQSRNQRIVVERLALDSEAAYTLELEPMEVWTPDVRVVVFEDEGVRERTPSRGRTFRGQALGVHGSSIVLRLRESGELHGLLNAQGRTWLIRDIGEPDRRVTWTRNSRARSLGAEARQEARGTLHVQEVDLHARTEEGFTCDQAALDARDTPLLAAEPIQDLATLRELSARSTRGAITHTARIAFATDYEYYQQFGDEDEAIEYIGDLIAYMSTIYENDVQTSLLASYVEIYTTMADPYTAAQGSCALFQFGKYWNDNRTDVDRTLAHLLSGRPSNIGVAWEGVLCSGSFSYSVGVCGFNPANDNFGGDYGYTGGIDGNFNSANPQVLWDLSGVAHEIGHNFNSPHTHCYNGLGGNSDPVDECYNGQAVEGCFAGTPSLPGPAGQGSGTLMSYCHLTAPDYNANISLTFGTGHPYGVEPERVPDRMRSHVLNRAASDPACLALTLPTAIFSDGFESGTTSSWSL